MMIPPFIVNISKLTRAITQRGFGLPLILGTTKDAPYTKFNSISEVASEFNIGTKEYQMALRIFGQNPAPPQIAIFSILPEDGDDVPALLQAVINEVVEVNNDWYYLTCTENSNAVVRALAGWAEAKIKTYWVTTQDLTLVNTLQFENTICMYHEDPEALVAEGLIATAATNNPGSLTFKFKGVRGVNASEIRATDLAALHANGGFTYIENMGVLQTSEGTVTTGEYIDIVMAGHWMKVRMEEEAAFLAVNTKKIPYDGRGIAMLISVVQKVIKRAGKNGIVKVDDDGNFVYNIEALRRDEVSVNDVANRVYNGLSWTVTLAGAIHTGTVSGIFQY
ncbi:MAG: DUF3383 domain-containing protein [Defluviitaleaceae bacterium]|nr:DUF3383 domain-containing protein [Defluviitaleaceae bacterium]MCL2273439.1 DUF3383 domain-containing protein [Defluviitaleaceae bacterium]